MNNNKNEKRTHKSILESKPDMSNPGLDSNEDLLAAIRQVAKEMAEAVKKTNKDEEKTRPESEKNYNDTKNSQQSFKREETQLKEAFNIDKKEILNIMGLNLNTVNNPINKNLNINNNLTTTNNNANNKNVIIASNIINKPQDPIAVRTTIYNDQEENPNQNNENNQVKSENENPESNGDDDSDDFNLDISPYLKYEDYKMDEYEEEIANSRRSLYERNVDAYNKLQKKLELQRHKKLNDELQKLKTKPELSKFTKKIIETKLNDYEPIYNRIDEEIFRKNQRLQILKFSLADEERIKEFQNISKFNTGVADQNQIDNFIKTQNEWKKKRDEKIANIKNEMGKMEDEASKYLFQPAILKSSEMIAKNKISKAKEKQVHTRLYNLHEEKIIKKKKMEKKSMPSFKPNINRNYPSYLKKLEKDKEQINSIEDDSRNNNSEDIYNDEYSNRSNFYSNKNNIIDNRHINSLWENVGVVDDGAGYNNRGFHNHNSKKKSQNIASDKNKMHIQENYVISGKNHNNNRSDDENYYKYSYIKKNNDEGNNYNSNIEKDYTLEDKYDDDDAFIKEYKKNLAKVHRMNSASNIGNSGSNQIIQDNQFPRFKQDRQSDWRSAIPKSIPTNNYTVNDWPDRINSNLYKINVNDHNDNIISATPQFAGMIKKNLNLIANAKMKYSK